jgi:iron(III) transport system permease protein
MIPMAALVLLIFVSMWMAFREPEAGGSFSYGAGAFPELLTHPLFRKTVVNTVLFAVTAFVTALFFGTSIAWIVERTDLRAKSLPRTLMVVGLLLPHYLAAMGWVLLFNYRIGVINTMIRSIPGFGWFTLDISHPAAMGFVQGLGLAALVFIMVSATFRAMNPALEEAAAIHGMRFLRRLRRITLPLTFPGILAAGIYISTIAISAFEIPAMIGMAAKKFTFSTFLWLLVNPEEGLPRYDLSGAYGIIIVFLSGFLMYWYFRTLRQSHKYVVVTGKAYRPTILPILILVYGSLVPYVQPISLSAFSEMGLSNYRALRWPMLMAGIKNTAILIVTVPTITLAISMAFSWIVIRSRTRSRFVFDAFAFLPHVVPHILLAASAIFIVLFLLPQWLPLYGHILIIIIMYSITYISFATRILNGALMQIHEELDEAATVSGVPMLQTFRKILFPLLRPALLSAWLWIAILSYRELSMASILSRPGNVTLPYQIFTLWTHEGPNEAAAAACLVLAFMIPLVFLYWFLGRRALAMAQ